MDMMIAAIPKAISTMPAANPPHSSSRLPV